MRTWDQTEERRSFMLWQSALSLHKVICNLLHNKKVCFKKNHPGCEVQRLQIGIKRTQAKLVFFHLTVCQKRTIYIKIEGKAAPVFHTHSTLSVSTWLPCIFHAHFIQMSRKISFELKVFFHFLVCGLINCLKGREKKYLHCCGEEVQKRIAAILEEKK